jgi:hypothetical protein
MTWLWNLVACFGVLVVWSRPALSQELFASACGEDAHIDASKRNDIDAVAVSFVEAVLSPNPSSAFGRLSKPAQATTTPQQFDAVGQIVRKFEPKNVTLQHTYLIQLKGKSPGRVVCATDLTKPDGWESLEAESVPEQAHVLLSADMVNNKLAIAMWLIPDDRGWKVQDFRVNVSTLADKDSMHLLQLARVQQEAKHNFNAALLYAAAAQTANRGPSFQLGLSQSISEEMAKLAVPDEIKGPPPFLWKNGETTYKVINLAPTAIGGKLYVVISYEVSPWQSNEQVDGWNKELLAYFKHRFPEYTDTFGGLVARATERASNRGFGTVDETSPSK